MRKTTCFAVILGPYGVLAAFLFVFASLPLENLLEDAFPKVNWIPLFSTLIIGIYLASLIMVIAGAVVTIVSGFRKKNGSLELSRINMIIKLAQIPAYVMIFAISCLSLMTIFTIGFTIAFLIADVVVITSTGMIGLFSAARTCREGKLPVFGCIILALLQFVFCADVIAAVVLYIVNRKKNNGAL